MINPSLLAQARQQGSSKASIAQAFGQSDPNQAIKDLSRRVESLERRLALIEQALSIGADGSVVLYSSASLLVYAEGTTEVNGRQGVVVDSGDSKFTASAGNVTVSAPSKITLNSGADTAMTSSKLTVNASEVDINAGMSKASGTVQCDTIIANSVVGSSYTPGAGNIW